MVNTKEYDGRDEKETYISFHSFIITNEIKVLTGIPHFSFFFFSEQKSKTVAPPPMKTRARAPEIKMPFFKILFILSALPIQINNITFFFRFSNPCTSDYNPSALLTSQFCAIALWNLMRRVSHNPLFLNNQRGFRLKKCCFLL